MTIDELKTEIDKILGEDVEGKAGLAVMEIFKALVVERDGLLKSKEALARRTVECSNLKMVLRHLGEVAGIEFKDEAGENSEIVVEDIEKAVQETVEKAGRRLSAKTLASLKSLATTLGTAQKQIEGVIGEESKEFDPEEQKTEEEERPKEESDQEPEVESEEKAATDLLASDELEELKKLVYGGEKES